MSNDSEKEPIFAAPTSGEPPPIYQERTKTKQMKVILGVFFGVLIFNLCLTTLFTGIQARLNPLLVLLLISLLCFAQIEVFIVYFVYTEKVTKNCFWAIFVFGVMIIVQCLSTDILVFTI